MFLTFILLRKGNLRWLEVNSHQALQPGCEANVLPVPVSRTVSRLGVWAPEASVVTRAEESRSPGWAASPHLPPIFSKPPSSWETSPNTWGQDSLPAYGGFLTEWADALNGTKYFPWGEICGAMVGGEQRIWQRWSLTRCALGIAILPQVSGKQSHCHVSGSGHSSFFSI